MAAQPARESGYGVLSASCLGVGATVGGGILALIGPAYSLAGPAITIAIFANMLIAFATASSAARLTSLMPSSGGPYLWAKKLWSVDLAFPVGLTVWLSSVLASSLYAIGFASFMYALSEKAGVLNGNSIANQTGIPIGVVCITGIAILLRKNTAGITLNILKLVGFLSILAVGLFGAYRNTEASIDGAMLPFAPTGWGQVWMAMGLLFVCVQGFDVIANIAGRVADAKRNVPIAMYATCVIAFAVYLPLILLLCLSVSAGLHPNSVEPNELVIANALEIFAGRNGHILVLCVGVLAMYSALEANLLGATEVAAAMSRDHTLPSWIANPEGSLKKEYLALAATAGIACLLILLLGDIESAGFATSFAFMLLFAFTNIACLFSEVRVGSHGRMQFAISLAGACFCIALALVQLHGPWKGPLLVVATCAAGLLYYVVFLAGRARVRQATESSLFATPKALQVLVPVSYEQNVETLKSIAEIFRPSCSGRVVYLSVMGCEQIENDDGTEPSQTCLSVSALQDRNFPETEALAVIADNRWEAISAVINNHRCETLLLGYGESDDFGSAVANILESTDAELVIVRPGTAPISQTNLNVLVPVSPYLSNRIQRAKALTRLLNQIDSPDNITLLRVLEERKSIMGRIQLTFSKWTASRSLGRYAIDCKLPREAVRIAQSENILETICSEAAGRELIVLGMPPSKVGGPYLTSTTKEIVKLVPEATIVIIGGG